MPIIRCPTPAHADQRYLALVVAKGAALFLFFGAEDPLTGTSWCPDCQTADPVLRRACRDQLPTVDLLECPVGQRSDWKQRPEHPYRLHHAFRIARIPTLLRFADGVEIGRLVEADCTVPQRVQAFLS